MATRSTVLAWEIPWTEEPGRLLSMRSQKSRTRLRDFTFIDLTFQVAMQYCSLQHWASLPSPVTSTTGCCFCFGSISSFFLELFLHWSPVAYLAPPDLGEFISQCPIFFAFSYSSWGSQGKNTEVVCHSLLQRTTFCQNCPPWPIRLGWPYMVWLIVSLS